MGSISRIKETWRLWRAYRKGKKMTTMKPITKSRTTATVAASTGTTGGIAFAALTFLRGRVDLPWGPEGDAAIVAILTTIIAPLLSRLIAKYRKAGDTVGPAALGFLLCGLAGVMTLMAAGCATTQVLGPDGTVIETRREADRELILQIATLAANPELYREGWNLFKEINDYRVALKEAEDKAERAAIEVKIRAAQDAIDGLVAAAQAAQGAG